mgnify:CR=1 FL=1
MCWALSFDSRMGMVLVDAFLVHLESISNFHGENLATFCLIFMAETR